ncbi:hypothetical protein M2158_008340 [Streptomyces sp. SAI-144]|nr:hypothetical protein [Streptomyces sp. SAI-144]
MPRYEPAAQSPRATHPQSRLTRGGAPGHRRPARPRRRSRPVRHPPPTLARHRPRYRLRPGGAAVRRPPRRDRRTRPRLPRHHGPDPHLPLAGPPLRSPGRHHPELRPPVDHDPGLRPAGHRLDRRRVPPRGRPPRPRPPLRHRLQPLHHPLRQLVGVADRQPPPPHGHHGRPVRPPRPGSRHSGLRRRRPLHPRRDAHRLLRHLHRRQPRRPVPLRRPARHPRQGPPTG